MAKYPYQRYNLLDPVGNVINGVIDLTQAAAGGLSAAMQAASAAASAMAPVLSKAAASASASFGAMNAKVASAWQGARAAMAAGAAQWWQGTQARMAVAGQNARNWGGQVAGAASSAWTSAGSAVGGVARAAGQAGSAVGSAFGAKGQGWGVAAGAMRLGARAFSDPVGAMVQGLSSIGPAGKAAGAALQLMSAASGAASRALGGLVGMTAKGAVNTSSTLQGSMDMLAATLVPILQPIAELATRVIQAGAGSMDRMAEAGSRYANAGAMVAEMFVNRVIGVDTYGQNTKRSMAGLAAPTMTGSMEAWADQAMMQSLKLGENSLEADMARRNLESMDTLIGLVREHIQVTRQNNPPIA